VHQCSSILAQQLSCVLCANAAMCCAPMYIAIFVWQGPSMLEQRDKYNLVPLCKLTTEIDKKYLICRGLSLNVELRCYEPCFVPIQISGSQVRPDHVVWFPISQVLFVALKFEPTAARPFVPTSSTFYRSSY